MIGGADARLRGTLGSEAVERLQGCEVAVIGAGLLGGFASLHLGMLGVAQRIVECGTVELANTGQQLLPFASIGSHKGRVRAQQIAALNPQARVRVFEGRIEQMGLAALADVDLLLTGLDSRTSRVRVAVLSHRLGLPWVDAAVDGSGESLFGTVTLYDPRARGTACYCCRYGARELARIAAETRGPGCPSWRGAGDPAPPPTLVASPFGAVVAGLQTLVAIRALLGDAGELTSRQLQIGADGTPRLRSLSLGYNERCSLDHRRLEPLHPSPGAKVGELLAAAASHLGAEPARVRFHDRVLVRGLRCSDCGNLLELVRLREAVRDEEVACSCQERAERTPVRMHHALERSEAEQLASRSWRELGFPQADVISAESADGGEVHYRIVD